jgi:hypothetical protein
METVWSITKLVCFPEYESESNVVANIEWKAVATQTESGTVFTAEETGTTGSGFAPNITDFTPYNQLTQQQVLDWVWANGVSQTVVELNLQNKINAQINPPVVTPPLPWAGA